MAVAREPDDDRFRLAMAASGIGMAIVDLQGRWIEVNPAFERMLGYRAEEVVGRPTAAFTHPDDIELTHNYVQSLIEGRVAMLDARKRYLHRDGHTVWVQANVAVMRNSIGAPLHLLVQLRDIGAELAAEESLKSDAAERNAELQASNRQLQLFADAVAHDLRAPLRSIESFSGLLADRAHDRLDDTDRDYLGRIRSAAARMTDLLDALNELSRATGAELKPGPVDLSLLADWVSAELQDAQPQREALIDVQPDLLGYGDERLLKLMLTQLLHNAWKFAYPDAPVRVAIRGERDDDMLRITVRDEGIGFDMRYAHKMFEPFQRLHGPEQGGGHGLGLAIAQRIAQRHRGRIQADSQPGAGSTFIVELPAAPAVEELR